MRVDQRRLDTAVAASRAAGAVLREHLQHLASGTLAIEAKTDDPLNLVSDVDRGSQAAAVQAIAQAFAPAWIVGEEALVQIHPDRTTTELPALGHDEQRRWARPDLASYWLIDGLDGTANYLRGLRPFCAAVAYVENGRLAVSAVYDPFADELFCAVDGEPATLNGLATAVSPTSALEGAVIATETFRPFWSAGIERWPRQLGVRTFGSPITSMAWVAAGRLDAYVYLDLAADQRIGPWDIVPGALLVERAGGMVSSPDGTPLDVWGRGIIAAATPALHAAIRERLPIR
jgi:myo-inositol-1(or 4)-monophosphatase